MPKNLHDVVYCLTGTTFRHGSQSVLTIPSLKIQRGQITTLLGSNGAGKTTLLNLLALLKRPAEGEVNFDGEAINAHTRDKTLLSLRRRVGLIAQNPLLLRGTVLQNVQRGLQFRGLAKADHVLRAQHALRRVGILSLQDRPARALSGGEAQKVALARILALEPDVLLLDEPFTYLDEESARDLANLLTDLSHQHGMTVVLSTHERRFGMALADQVISLVQGRPVAAPLVNVFHGEVQQGQFATEKIRITLPDDITEGQHILIDPKEIVLSKTPIESSMRNHFHGQVVGIEEEHGRDWITVMAGERFYVEITRQSLLELDLRLGADVQIYFKSTAVRVV